MNMSLGMGLSLVQTQDLRQELRLTCEQRLAKALTLRQSLLYAVSGEKYEPAGDCPKCNAKLKPVEIVSGFRRDPNDYTTKCPKCGTRFTPKIVNRSPLSTLEMPFYCPSQTLARLPSCEPVAVAEFRKRYAAEFCSALYHFGSLKAAFHRVGINYRFSDRINGWKRKITRFLGKLPDQVIADAIGISLRKVKKLRQERGILAYKRGA